ncbi:Uncharacterised protein [Listeria newyorkensis]|nr:Uncharacterised protein [Listeria newyorkensis]
MNHEFLNYSRTLKRHIGILMETLDVNKTAV